MVATLDLYYLELTVCSYRLRPYTPANIQNLLLSHTIQMVDGVAAYHVRREKTHHLKRKALQIQDRNKNKRCRVEGPSDSIARQAEGKDRPGEADRVDLADDEPSTTPPSLPYLTVGINEVTRQLEGRIRTLGLGRCEDVASVWSE